MPAKRVQQSKTKKPPEPQEEKAPSLPGPFDFLNSINAGKNGMDLLAPCRAHSESAPDVAALEKSYVAFIINRGLSYFPDTVLFANEMNRCSSLPAKMQFDFLRLITRPRRRFSKWMKKEDDSKDVEIIKGHYRCSAEKARDYLRVYTTEALEKLRKKYDRGGR